MRVFVGKSYFDHIGLGDIVQIGRMNGKLAQVPSGALHKLRQEFFIVTPAPAFPDDIGPTE
jgi:hypothetical protein